MDSTRARPPLRWGFLSTAQIARKNWLAIRNSGNATVTAVASRDRERAERFIQTCQAEAPLEPVPRVLDSYEALVKAPDVDAIYFPLPTALRHEWVVRAAEAGKHVLCEKPCAGSVAELAAMTEACRRHGVQFMDGVMFMHGIRLDHLRAALDDQAGVGTIRRIDTAFSFRGDDAFFAGNIRMDAALEPHGCVGDLGWYCIRFALWALREQLPRRVTGRFLSRATPDGRAAPVPLEFSGELLFDGDVSSGFYCAFLTENQQWANVGGTAGSLRLTDFVLPFAGSELSFEVTRPVYTVRGCDFRMEPGRRIIRVTEASHGAPDAQETRLFRRFTEQVRSGRLNPEWPEQAMNTQRVMEACLVSARQGGRPVELA